MSREFIPPEAAVMESQENYAAADYAQLDELVEDTVDRFLERSTGVYGGGRKTFPLNTAYKIVKKSPIEEQDFIEAVISLLEKVDSLKHRHDGDYLVSDIISNLQWWAHQNLVMDYRSLFESIDSNRSTIAVGSDIAGRGETQLKVSYHLPDDMSMKFLVGTYASYTDISVMGEVEFAGSHARYCNFHLEKTPWRMGRGSEHCHFYLEDAASGSVRAGRKDSKSVYYVSDHDDCELAELTGEFFDKGNHLYIPDGDGWKEVRPR